MNADQCNVTSDSVTPENLSEGRTVTIDGFVYEMDFGGGKEYRFFSTDKQGDRWYTLIGPASFSYTIPASFNPTAAKLAALEEKKRQVRAEFARMVAELDEEIGKLQALEYVEA